MADECGDNPPSYVPLPCGGEVSGPQKKLILWLTHVKVSTRPPRASRAGIYPEGGRELTLRVETTCPGSNCEGCHGKCQDKDPLKVLIHKWNTYINKCSNEALKKLVLGPVGIGGPSFKIQRPKSEIPTSKIPRAILQKNRCLDLAEIVSQLCAFVVNRICNV